MAIAIVFHGYLDTFDIHVSIVSDFRLPCAKLLEPARYSDGLSIFLYCGHVAEGSRFTIGWAPVVGTCGRRYGRLAVLWHE